MIDQASELRPEWLQGRNRVDASAPEVLVPEVIARLQALGAKRVTQLKGNEEGVTFRLPNGLSATA